MFEHRYGLTGWFQSTEIERLGEKRSIMDVHQVPAGQIPAVIAPPLYNPADARSQRQHHNIRVVETLSGAMRGEQHVTAGQYLGESMGHLPFSERRQTLWRPAAHT